MMKRLLVVGITFLLVLGLAGCGKKADEQELQNAENLTEGFEVMMRNVRAYSGLSTVGPKPQTLSWLDNGTWSEEQAVFYVPEGNETLYYYIRAPFSFYDRDDTLLFLVHLTPDYHPDYIPDTAHVSLIDFWQWFVVRDDIWWHYLINIDETDVSHAYGTMKWHYDDTLWIYTYFVSIESDDKFADIDVETNFDVAAEFLLAADGSGDPEENFGTYEGERFVEYTFDPTPGETYYEGYYTLASEDWDVEHYFRIDLD
jgi:hypothetical protein